MVAIGHDSGASPGLRIAKGRWSLPARLARAGLLAVGAAALLVLAGFTFFAQHVGAMKTPAELRQADAIVVLTGGQFRINAAIDLLKSGKGERLLISGVNPIASARDIQTMTGADKALVECCVDIDHAALDTIGNAAESAKWVRDHGYDSLIVVTNNYHIPRSLLEMRRYLREADLQPYPVVNAPLENGGWLTRPDALRVLFTEYTKYLASLARGALDEGAGRDVASVVNASAAK